MSGAYNNLNKGSPQNEGGQVRAGPSSRTLHQIIVTDACKQKPGEEDSQPPNKRSKRVTSSGIECEICNQEFNDDQRCPRNLVCGHSFCTFCINQLIIRNQKTCPTCGKSFDVKSVQEVIKNFIALNLLKKVKDLEERGSRGFTEITISEIIKKKKKKSRKLDKNILKCKTVIDQITAIKENNSELKRSISQKLSELKQDISALEENCQIKLQFLDKTNEKLDKMLSDAKEEQTELEKLKVSLAEDTTIMKAVSTLEEAEVSNAAAELSLQEMTTVATRNKNVHQGLKKSMKTVEEKQKHIREILSTLEDGDEINQHLVDITLQEENEPHITPQILQRMSLTTRVLLSLQGVYVVQQERLITRYGKLSVSEKRLFLHHLTERQAPTNASTVKFEDVMKLVDSSSRLTFLDFGHKESTIGRIIVRLPGDTKRAQNFSLLCSGEKGHSFSQTKILTRRKSDMYEHVMCGGFYTKSGLSGKTLVVGAREESGGKLEQTLAAGSVFGWTHIENYKPNLKGNVGSFFAIATNVYESEKHPVVFGIVEKGLHVLQSIALHPSPTEIEIRDCGIVLTE